MKRTYTAENRQIATFVNTDLENAMIAVRRGETAEFITRKNGEEFTAVRVHFSPYYPDAAVIRVDYRGTQIASIDCMRDGYFVTADLLETHHQSATVTKVLNAVRVWLGVAGRFHAFGRHRDHIAYIVGEDDEIVFAVNKPTGGAQRIWSISR